MNESFAARIAEAYGQHSQKYSSVLEPILVPMAGEIVGLARIKGGERLLDLATGTGLIARTAAAAGAAVIGIDISLGILTRAHTRSAGTILYLVGDAHSLPFHSQSFDLVTCSLSLSHFSDISVALREVLRVLRPSGRFITSAWGVEGENPSKAAAVEVRKRYLEEWEITFKGTFGDELWADAELGRETLRTAGFVDVQVTTRPLSGQYRNSAEAIETALAWPLTRCRIASLDPGVQQRLKEETAAAIQEVDDLSWNSEIHYYHAFRP